MVRAGNLQTQLGLANPVAGGENIEATPGLSIGLVLSRSHPEIGQFDNELNQILDGDFHIGAEIHWDRFIKNLVALTTPSAASSTYRNSREADRYPNTQCGLDPNPGPHALPYQGRDDVTGVKIEVVPRTVQVHWGK